MRNLIIILFTIIFTSCSYGIKITKKDYKNPNDTFHKVVAHKIIEHTDKYHPKFEKIKIKVRKHNLKIVKFNSKKKSKHSKRLVSTNRTFDHH